MGDPRRLRNKYSKPNHPWQKERIEEERTLVNEFGLKNKTEIYRHRSQLKTFADLAKKLIAARGIQAEKERQQLLNRLTHLGLVKAGAQLDDVLGIRLRNLLERRLQTIVVRKGLARSMNQARQFIVHEHIAVSNRVITAPGHHVSLAEEPATAFVSTSPLANASHVERVLLPKALPEPRVGEDKMGKRKRSGRGYRQ